MVRVGPIAAAFLAMAGGATAIAPERQEQLEQMVIQDCGSCHGLAMTGGLGKPITPQALSGLDPETLASVILDGVPGTAMPPWRPLLTEAEALWIAEYLRKEKAP